MVVQALLQRISCVFFSSIKLYCKHARTQHTSNASAVFDRVWANGRCNAMHVTLMLHLYGSRLLWTKINRLLHCAIYPITYIYRIECVCVCARASIVCSSRCFSHFFCFVFLQLIFYSFAARVSPSPRIVFRSIFCPFFLHISDDSMRVCIVRSNSGYCFLSSAMPSLAHFRRTLIIYLFFSCTARKVPLCHILMSSHHSRRRVASQIYATDQLVPFARNENNWNYSKSTGI